MSSLSENQSKKRISRPQRNSPKNKKNMEKLIKKNKNLKKYKKLIILRNLSIRIITHSNKDFINNRKNNKNSSNNSTNMSKKM